jgi:hypothetical protein
VRRSCAEEVRKYAELIRAANIEPNPDLISLKKPLTVQEPPAKH